MKRWNLLHSQMLGVGLAAFGMLLVGTSALMLYPLDEAKNAECPLEMLGRGDWIVPTFNGELRTDKSPFHYWIMMLCYQFFGPTEWSARLGSVLSGVGTVLITFRFAWQYLGRLVAWVTATLLLASLHIGIQFRMAVPDPYLIFLMTLAFYFFFSWYKEQRTQSLYVFYAAIGIGMLAKGLLPTVAVVLFLWSAGRMDVLRRMRWWQGALLIMAMALPWYVAVD